jgi:lipoprotein-anchoring transpeptidase ErfK/SrfK
MLGAAPVRGAPPDVVTMDVGDEPGAVVISTADRLLYLILGGDRALRCGIGVGREGFQRSGAGEDCAQGRVARLDAAA